MLRTFSRISMRPVVDNRTKVVLYLRVPFFVAKYNVTWFAKWHCTNINNQQKKMFFTFFSNFSFLFNINLTVPNYIYLDWMKDISTSRHTYFLSILSTRLSFSIKMYTYNNIIQDETVNVCLLLRFWDELNNAHKLIIMSSRPMSAPRLSSGYFLS